MNDTLSTFGIPIEELGQQQAEAQRDSLHDAKADLERLENERREISNRHIWNNAMSKGSRPAPPDTREIDTQIAEAKEKAGKAFWQRTQEQVARVLSMPADKHRQYVEQAIKDGKQVPPLVLADYPDLAQ